LLAFASPATAATAPDSDRLSGPDRYATAADVALDSAWGNNKDSITVVNGENFPDGLAAAALGDRILLVRADSIPAATSDAIKALEKNINGGDGVGTINVVGGTGVVSSSVLEQLDALNGSTDGVVRHGGDTRYDTAIKVAKAIATANGGLGNVVLATGTDFPDALAAGPLAVAAGAPIVLNSGASLLPAVKAFLQGATGTVHVIGGEGVIPKSVVQEIQAMGKPVVRIGGDTREETAVAISTFMLTKLAGAGSQAIVNVTRNGFADALSAGPFASAVNGSIQIVDVAAVSNATVGWHLATCSATTGGNGIFFIGGTGVISDAIADAAVGAATCVDIDGTAVVSNSDFKQRVIELESATGACTGNQSVAVVTAGVTLTAVLGSAATGTFGNLWTVAVQDGAASDAGAVVDNSNPTAPTLTVTIPIGATGMTQADLAAAWNGFDAAAALFTAAPNGDSATPTKYADGNLFCNVDTKNGSQDQTVTITLNQPVADSANPLTREVLDTTDMVFDTGTPTSSTPLPNTDGGSATYTVKFNDVTNPADIMLGTVAAGDTVTLEGYNTITGAVYTGNDAIVLDIES
jgi:putative cell wall-binding protein